MKNPCRYCQRRTATCHAECEDYAAFAKEREHIRKLRTLENEVHGATIHRSRRNFAVRYKKTRCED